MTALWISLAVAVVLLAGWRLRRATKVLDGILREEREHAERAAATDCGGESAEPTVEDHRAENSKS